MSKKNWYVYVHTFPDKKHYVGITCQEPKARWNKGYGYCNQGKVYEAIRRFGWENVDHVVYSVGSEQLARCYESLLINVLDSVINGYNVKVEVFQFSYEALMYDLLDAKEKAEYWEKQAELWRKVKTEDKDNEIALLKKQAENTSKAFETVMQSNRAMFAMLVRAGVM